MDPHTHMRTLTHTEPPNVTENVRSDKQDEQITLLQWKSEASKQQQGIMQVIPRNYMLNHKVLYHFPELAMMQTKGL